MLSESRSSIYRCHSICYVCKLNSQSGISKKHFKLLLSNGQAVIPKLWKLGSWTYANSNSYFKIFFNSASFLNGNNWRENKITNIFPQTNYQRVLNDLFVKCGMKYKLIGHKHRPSCVTHKSYVEFYLHSDSFIHSESYVELHVLAISNHLTSYGIQLFWLNTFHFCLMVTIYCLLYQCRYFSRPFYYLISY